MSKFEKERQRKMSTKFNDFLKEQLQDPEFQKEYEALQPEHAIMQAIIDARKLSGLTQKSFPPAPVSHKAISVSWSAAMQTRPFALYSVWL